MVVPSPPPPCPVCAEPCLEATAEYRADDEIRAAPVRLYPAPSSGLEAWRLGPCGHRILADAYTLHVDGDGTRIVLNAGAMPAHVTARPGWIPTELTFPPCPQCGTECAWLEPNMPEPIGHYDPVRGVCIAVDLAPPGWVSIPCGHVMRASEWHLMFTGDGRAGEWAAGPLTPTNLAEYAAGIGMPLHPAIVAAGLGVPVPRSPATSSAPADATDQGEDLHV